MYQALYRKWRPRTFQEVVGQTHITDTLRRQVASGRLSHAYLFTGTRGTGKTTCAKLLARAVNCQQPVDGSPCNQCPACLGIEDGSILDVLELDAASNNGVDQVRALRDEAVYTPTAVKKRVYIVDEVHMLSTPAFNALLKILEEPPEHLMFILATTELHKVPATIKSRCQQFAFRRLLPEEISGRLNYVCTQEGIPLSTDAAALLARLADGGMRDALSLLDQCAGYAETVDVPQVLEALGLAGDRETADLLEAAALEQTDRALKILDRLYAAGKELRSVLGELSALVRDLLVEQTAPKGGAALLTGGYDEATRARLSKLLSPARLLQMLTLLQNTLADLGRGSNPRTDAELCLIRLCDPTLDGSFAGLTARLERLERQMEGRSVPRPEETKAEAGLPEKKERASSPPADDVPPWNTAEPERPVQPKRESLPPPGSAAQPRQQPVSAVQEAPAPAVGTPSFWPTLLKQVVGKIPMGEYTFLCDHASTDCRLQGDVLELWAANDFIRGLLDKPGVLEPVSSLASTLAGHPLRAVVKQGVPPVSPSASSVNESPEQEDPFQDLLNLGGQFDNITIV